MDLAADVDPGFSKERFAESLAGIDRFPDSDFAVYGVDAERVSRVRDMMREWSRELAVERSLTPTRTVEPAAEAPDRGGPNSQPPHGRPSGSERRRVTDTHSWPGQPDMDYQPPNPGLDL
jgi:hypothetical protein